jgi:hypothetical protein
MSLLTQAVYILVFGVTGRIAVFETNDRKKAL